MVLYGILVGFPSIWIGLFISVATPQNLKKRRGWWDRDRMVDKNRLLNEWR